MIIELLICIKISKWTHFISLPIYIYKILNIWKILRLFEFLFLKNKFEKKNRDYSENIFYRNWKKIFNVNTWGFLFILPWIDVKYKKNPPRKGKIDKVLDSYPTKLNEQYWRMRGILALHYITLNHLIWFNYWHRSDIIWFFKYIKNILALQWVLPDLWLFARQLLSREGK